MQLLGKTRLFYFQNENERFSPDFVFFLFFFRVFLCFLWLTEHFSVFFLFKIRLKKNIKPEHQSNFTAQFQLFQRQMFTMHNENNFFFASLFSYRNYSQLRKKANEMARVKRHTEIPLLNTQQGVWTTFERLSLSSVDLRNSFWGE